MAADETMSPGGEGHRAGTPTPAVAAAGRAVAATVSAGDDEAIFDALAAGTRLDDDAWPSRPRRAGLRLAVPTAVLVALVIAAGAFWAGAAVQKADGTSSGGGNLSGASSRLRSLLGGASGASSFFGSGSGGSGLGGFAPAARGTLTAVVGNTLYLTTSTGSLVKVQLSPSTTITRTTKAGRTSLHSGDTIVVRGTASSSGVVSATAITATAKGVASASSSGRRGVGGFGGGSGAGSSGGNTGG